MEVKRGGGNVGELLLRATPVNYLSIRLFSLSGQTDLTLMLHYNKSLTDYVDALNTWQRNNVILISVIFDCCAAREYFAHRSTLEPVLNFGILTQLSSHPTT